jgi:Cof subfamily protein (haloacid dehalogenase superfamily)
MKHISLLIADVDGTLVTEQKVLTERARTAVAALRDRGIRFAITSGRPPRGMAMLIEPLALDTPIAGFNGGVFTCPDLSVIETRTLAPDVARRAIAIIQSHGMDAWLYTGTDWLIHKQDAPHVAREAWTVKFEPKIVARYDDADLDQAVKIVGVSDDHALVGRCEADVSAALGAHASAKRSQPYYLDVTHPDANKGAVVDALVRRLGVLGEEVATIGDMPNDVLMFRRSGFSIAMGNASDEVKAQASAVTDSYNDEGFAKAVERYLLNESRP